MRRHEPEQGVSLAQDQGRESAGPDEEQKLAPAQSCQPLLARGDSDDRGERGAYRGERAVYAATRRCGQMPVLTRS